MHTCKYAIVSIVNIFKDDNKFNNLKNFNIFNKLNNPSNLGDKNNLI